MQWSRFLKTRIRETQQQVFDPVRRKWVAFAPEEMVRQLLILYFIQERHFPASRMSVERKLEVLGMPRRYDLVLYDTRAMPVLLAECKAPTVNISQASLDQIARYNITLKVPYILVTNGRQSFCCNIDFETQSWKFLDSIPEMLK